jgi:ribosome biogenesis protein Nip4
MRGLRSMKEASEMILNAITTVLCHKCGKDHKFVHGATVNAKDIYRSIEHCPTCSKKG